MAVRKIVACVMGLALGPLAWAGLGDVSGGLTHARCEKGKTSCSVEVKVAGSGPAGNSCGIRVPNIVLLHRSTTTLTWNLSGSGFEFAPVTGAHDGVDILDNDEREDGAAPTLRRVFTRAGTPTAVLVSMAVSQKARDKLRKAFVYTVHVRRTGGAGSCDPYDPVIVTRGD